MYFVIICSLQVIRDPAKDKPLELEMGWLCADNKFVFSHVPKDLVASADAAALAELGNRDASATATAAAAESEPMQEDTPEPALVDTEEKEMDVTSDL